MNKKNKNSVKVTLDNGIVINVELAERRLKKICYLLDAIPEKNKIKKIDIKIKQNKQNKQINKVKVKQIKQIKQLSI